MNYRLVHLFILSGLFLFITAVNSSATEIYFWIDGNGIMCITDRPPADESIIIDIERYKKDSPWEINLYKMTQKTRSIMNDQAVNYQQRINEINSQFSDNLNRLKDAERERQINAASEKLKSAEEYQEYLADRRRSSKLGFIHDIYDDAKNRQDKRVDQLRRDLVDKKNQR